MSNNCGTTNSGNEPIPDVPSHLQWLKCEAPGFSVHGDQIKVLFSPEEFYSAIIEGCQTASQRIALAALYIGMGALEEKMVKVLDDRMTELGNNLKVTILLDAVRGARDDSASTLLLPLIRKHPLCQVCLFHNPGIRGLYLHLPSRAKECIGIQHMKIYVFDDNVIISGANLTKEYFTDRRDRYMMISNCQPLASFCTGLIEKLSLISLRLLEDNTLMSKSPEIHPYLSPYEKYVKFAKKVIWDYYKQALKEADTKLRSGDDTWVFPVLQLPPLAMQQDSCVTQTLLESMEKNTAVHLTSPYFNPPKEYVISLLEKCRATLNILIPHPSTNDFFGAKGFAGQIPAFYTVLAKRFFHRLENTGQAERVSLQEFFSPTGSFHCKGVWLTEVGDVSPYLTIIGSSNFNYRSVTRDLECQMLIVTNNKDLRKRLLEEREHLYRHGIPFTHEVLSRPERKLKFWQQLFVWIFKSYL